MERKFAAILAADVVDYSRHVDEAEEPAVSLLHDYLAVINQHVERHQGRVFSSAGDSVVAEFTSPVEAVRCAVDVQQAIESENAKITKIRSMRFRIGIHSGDVVIDGTNLQGEAVNIAARIQSLAVPGGVFLSEDVYRHVHRILKLNFYSIGSRRLKNIAEPIRIYGIQALPSSRLNQFSRLVVQRGATATASVLAGLAIMAVGWIYQDRVLDSWRDTFGARRGLQTDRPSIAVLPFKSISAKTDEDYFSDGLTQDITGELSRFKHLKVIASNSAFTYKGKSVKVQEIGSDLGVEYLLEGTVQRNQNRIRLTAQLVDAGTGWQLWGDRYDRDGNDIFDIQDNIIQAVVTSLNLEVNTAEVTRIMENGTGNANAYDHYLKGRQLFYAYTQDAVESAKSEFSEAIRLDTNFAQAYGWLGYVYLAEVQEGWATNVEKNLTLALQFATKGVELAPDDYYTHWNLASIYAGRKDMASALEEYNKALALNSNDPDMLAEMADMLSYRGEADKAIDQIERAKELNPKYPDWYDWSLGFAHFQERQYTEAVAALKRMRDPPNTAYVLLVACKAKLGQATPRDEIMRRLLSKDPQWTPDHLTRFPFVKPEDEQHYLDALAAAGIPEPRK
jgi:TolB-like protein/class 3 adenylate cyclase/Tfp pilus assembly protein PilF